MKKIQFITLVVMLGLFATACTAGSHQSFTMPQRTPTVSAPIGDASSDYEAYVNIYLPDRFTYKLNKSIETMQLSLSDKSYEQIVNFILSFQGNEEYASPTFGTKIALYGDQPVAVYTNHAIVNLTPNALLLDKEKFYLLATCIAESLIDFCNIESVNVLVADKAVPINNLKNIPIGSIEKSIGNAPFTEFVKLSETRDSKNKGVRMNDMPISLFFPSNSGEGLLAEGRTVSFSSFAPEDAVLQILQELSLGSRYMENKLIMPNFVQLLSMPPEVTEWKEGGNLITLRFKSVFEDVVSASKISTNTALAMLCYSLSNFYPDVAGVKVLVDGQLVQKLEPDDIIDEPIDLNQGFLTKKLLQKYMLKQTELYFINASNTALEKTIRLIPFKWRLSPRNIILELAKGPKELDYILQPTLSSIPFELNDVDILGIALQQNKLVINFSQHVLANLHHLDRQGEKLFVYSIVNTLCKGPIKSVQFLFDGQGVDYINGELYWQTEFLPNYKLS